MLIYTFVYLPVHLFSSGRSRTELNFAVKFAGKLKRKERSLQLIKNFIDKFIRIFFFHTTCYFSSFSWRIDLHPDRNVIFQSEFNKWTELYLYSGWVQQQFAVANCLTSFVNLWYDIFHECIGEFLFFFFFFRIACFFYQLNETYMEYVA